MDKEWSKNEENKTIFPQIANYYLAAVGGIEYITRCNIVQAEMPK